MTFPFSFPCIGRRILYHCAPGKSPGCLHLNKTNDICKDLISKQGHIQRLWVDMTLKVKVLVAQSCPTLCDRMACPWNSLGKNTGVDCHSLLQGIFPTQGMNQGSLHCRQISFYHLSCQGSMTLRHVTRTDSLFSHQHFHDQGPFHTQAEVPGAPFCMSPPYLPHHNGEYERRKRTLQHPSFSTF